MGRSTIYCFGYCYLKEVVTTGRNSNVYIVVISYCGLTWVDLPYTALGTVI